jgi:hypothetical protein
MQLVNAPQALNPRGARTMNYGNFGSRGPQHARFFLVARDGVGVPAILAILALMAIPID